MISTARGVHRGLRSSRLEEVRPNWLQDILQSIRWMHREHVKDLRGLGYSPKEAFWLDFACLPFLPWDKAAGPELRLSTILSALRGHPSLHRRSPWSPRARRRSSICSNKDIARSARRSRESDGPTPKPAGLDPSVCTEKGPPKWALAGLIITRTAREWRQHRSVFPCRLVEDV